MREPMLKTIKSEPIAVTTAMADLVTLLSAAAFDTRMVQVEIQNTSSANNLNWIFTTSTPVSGDCVGLIPPESFVSVDMMPEDGKVHVKGNANLTGFVVQKGMRL